MAWLVAVVLVVVAPGLLVLPAAVAADPVVENVVSFSDVPESSQFATEISWLAASGISTGWDAGGGVRQYRPLESIARDAMAAFLYRHAGSPAFTAPAVSPFTDVPAGAAFYKEITWLAAEGISTGWDIGNGKREYRPLSPIARDAMAAFLYRYADKPAFTAPPVSPFVDVPVGGGFYAEITWLAASGISTGWDVGNGVREYRPLNGIARDAMAAFLYRYADKPAFTAPPVSPFVDVPVGGGFYAEITWLAASGISTGWDVGNGVREYRPLNGIARDAMAAFLYRYAGQKAPADPGNPAAGTVTVAPDVEILEPSQLETALVTADTVVLPSDQATEIKPNDVLVSGVTTGTPDGLLVRVVQVVRDPGGNTLVKTKPATLPEAVVSTGGLLEVSGTPVRSEFIPEPDVVVEPDAAPTATKLDTEQSPEMAQPFAEASADVFNKSMTFKKTVKGEFGKPDAPLTGNGSVTLKSSVTAKATAKMTLDVGFLQLKEASVVVTPSVKAEHSVTAEGSLKGQVTSKLGELNAWFTFWVGPVPVAVEGEAEMNANFALDGDAQVVFSSSQTVSSGHGFKYKNGSFNLVNDKPSTAGIQNQYKASASLTVRASLDFDATIKLYGVAGITFGMGPYATTTITVTAASGQQLSWTCPLELGVEGRLGVTAGIEIMGFDLGEWEATVTKSWPLFTANPCQGTTVIQPPPTNPTPTPTPTSTPEPEVVQRSFTGSSTVAYEVQSDGTVRTWGADAEGSLPEPVPGLSGVKHVAAGHGASYAVKLDGTVWAWGNNSSYQLGDGSTDSRSTPAPIQGLSDVVDVAAMYYGAIALKKDGSVWAWGLYTLGPDAMQPQVRPVPARLTSLSSITAISAGPAAGYALKSDGTLWAWGRNGTGELGDGTTTERLDPIKVNLDNVKSISAGNGTAYALKTDGTAWAWGNNSWGQLGDGTTTWRHLPVAIAGLSGVASLEAGDGNGYALMKDGTVRGWGYNVLGSVGSGDTNERHLPTPVVGVTGAVAVFGGVGYAFVVLGNGDALAWGWNEYGQLGDGTNQNRPSPVPFGVYGSPL
ncbi:RCC1 domain-containing protein [Paenarthrobacter nitroguajacolicus]|uniref:RCC1 domain-containing protein n=1 Tax=Paenarthrobacter nitroguajacolicus TaxID=211146 RepID=UPI001AAEC4D6|nr:S-layer homology domain-containing protein [Paenarthrobacter nitroguajacolicus]